MGKRSVMITEHCKLEVPDSVGNPVTDGERAGLVLPFVGRESDLARAIDFVQSAVAGHELSLLWIEGEAGIGKSRLLDEILSRIEDSIEVIQTRFNPDSRTSLARSLYVALNSSDQITDGTLTAASDQLPELLGRLRTEARLKPLLLIVEDVHLLDAKTMTELVQVLHGLEKESLGVICTARPGNETVYGAVLPFLMDTIQLNGLSTEDIKALGDIWGYDMRHLDNLVDFVHEHTHGIPLIVQSVFNDMLVSKPERSRNALATVRRIAFDTKLSLTQGLMRGLSAEDLVASRRLATLGKNFSSREAEFIMEDAAGVLDRLNRRGILIYSYREIEPLYGTPSLHTQYEFSHSLLHEQLLAEAPPPGHRSLELLLSGIPVYSTVPFTYISGIRVPEEKWETIYRILTERCISTIDELVNSPDWEIASTILKVARELYRNHQQFFPEALRKSVSFDLLSLQLQILNAFPSHPDFIKAADALLEITTSPQTLKEAEYRLQALEYSLYRADNGWTFRADEVFAETEQIVESFPGMLLDERYLGLLGNVAGAMRASSPMKAIEGVRRRFDSIIGKAEQEENEEARRMAFLDIAPNFIPLFQTEEELEDRKALAEQILREYGAEAEQGRFATSWPRFLEMTGDVHRAREVLKNLAPHPLSGYNLSREFAFRLLELLVNAAIEPDLQKIRSWAFALLEEFRKLQHMDGDDGEASLAQTAIAAHVLLNGIMRGETDWAVQVALDLCGRQAMISQYMAFERAALNMDREELTLLLENDRIIGSFRSLVHCVLNTPEADCSQAVADALRVLGTPVLQRHDILEHRIVASLVLTGNNEDLRREVRPAMRTAMQNSFQWLAERHLKLYALPLLKLAEKLLENTEYIRYREMFEEKQAGGAIDLQSQPPADETAHINISMLGEITIQLPGGKAKKIRGSRMKYALAALTANELAETPLSLAHFRAVATESDDPEEGASYLRILISRLRKQLGKEGITSDGKAAPQLNLSLIRVDLIEAVQHIQQGIEFAQVQHARHSFDAISRGLDILSKGDPYPDLENDFFDAIRQELKNKIRSGILLVTQMLRKHGDEKKVHTLLEKALTIFTDDEELIAQLEDQ